MIINLDPKILNGFSQEVRSYLPLIREGIEIFHGNNAQCDSLEDALRFIHTIKGASALMGLAILSELVAYVEDMLERIIDGRMLLDVDRKDWLCHTVDQIGPYLDGLLLGKADEKTFLQEITRTFQQFQDTPVSESSGVDGSVIAEVDGLNVNQDISDEVVEIDDTVANSPTLIDTPDLWSKVAFTARGQTRDGEISVEVISSDSEDHVALGGSTFPSGHYGKEPVNVPPTAPTNAAFPGSDDEGHELTKAISWSVDPTTEEEALISTSHEGSQSQYHCAADSFLVNQSSEQAFTAADETCFPGQRLEGNISEDVATEAHIHDQVSDAIVPRSQDVAILLDLGERKDSKPVDAEVNGIKEHTAASKVKVDHEDAENYTVTAAEDVESNPSPETDGNVLILREQVDCFFSPIDAIDDDFSEFNDREESPEHEADCVNSSLDVECADKATQPDDMVVAGIVSGENQSTFPPDITSSDGPLSTTPGPLDALINTIDQELCQVYQSDSTSTMHRLSPQYKNMVERYLLFTVGGTDYAVTLSHIMEIGKVPCITPVPNVPEWIPGIISLRGEILSIVDLCTFLGTEGTMQTDSRRMIVAKAEHEELTTSLMVDEIKGFLRIDTDRIGNSGISLNDKIAPYLRGVYEYDDQILAVIDLERFLTSSDIHQFD